jgi:arabinofuranosyltransferase
MIHSVARRLATVVALASLVAVCLAWALKLDFLADDAFITFRYARNLARGEGLVYNPGERVEGYTNFLEVVILAGLHRLGADLVKAGRALGLVSAAAAVLLTWAVARRTLARETALALVAAALVAVDPYFAAWAGAGLETTLFAALLMASTLCLLSPPLTRGTFLVCSAVALLLAWTRPEGVALYGVLAVCAAAAGAGGVSQRVGVLWPGLALFVGVGAVYFLARWTYFGDLLPNTFYAKSAFTPNHFRRGLEYLKGFGSNGFVLWSLPLCAAGGWTACSRRIWTLVALPLVAVGIAVAEGGDGLPMYRFLVPAVPLLAVLLALGCETASLQLRRVPGLVLGLSMAAVVCLFSFYPRQDEQLQRFLDQRDHEIPTWSATGRALRAAFPPETTVAVVPIGAVGYYSDLRVIDMLGLTDRTIARERDPQLGSGWAGHEKHDGAYVLSRRPNILLLGNVYADWRPTLPPGMLLPSSPATLAREMDVLINPVFQGDYEMRHLRLETGSWLHYFERRDLAR